MVGYLAYSIAGHDKDAVYLIIKEENGFVWLVDGRVRTLQNPKRKNKKHIQVIKKQDYKAGLESMTNEQIKRICKDIQEVK
ncbi:MAG: KOW domain-containing RNA-binding protein [Roseburia sp.]|nr:KOW domain-containing RNA-binding protein [Roseburia sp.]